MQIEKIRARKTLRENLAQSALYPILLMWKLRPRKGGWPTQGEQAMTCTQQSDRVKLYLSHSAPFRNLATQGESSYSFYQKSSSL